MKWAELEGLGEMEEFGEDFGGVSSGAGGGGWRGWLSYIGFNGCV